MDKPFVGFDKPTENWSKMPHALIENMHLIETKGEYAVILYILRHTWGYHDEWGHMDTEKRISIDEFMGGRKRKKGLGRVDKGTGIGSRSTIVDALRRAEKHGFIQVTRDDSDGGRRQRLYSLRMK